MRRSSKNANPVAAAIAVSNEVLLLRPRGPMSSTCIQETVTGHLFTQILCSFLHLAPLTCLFFTLHLAVHLSDEGKDKKLLGGFLGKR